MWGAHHASTSSDTTTGNSLRLPLLFLFAIDLQVYFSPGEMATGPGEESTSAKPAVANPAVAEIKAVLKDTLLEVLRENPALLRLPEDAGVSTGMFIAEAWGLCLH